MNDILGRRINDTLYEIEDLLPEGALRVNCIMGFRSLTNLLTDDGNAFRNEEGKTKIVEVLRGLETWMKAWGLLFLLERYEDDFRTIRAAPTDS